MTLQHKNKKYDSYRIEIFILLIGLLLICYLNSYLICLWATSFYLSTEDNLYIVYTTAQTLMLCCFEILGTIFLINYLKTVKSKINKEGVIFWKK